jgi:hypothetical protein
MGSLANQLNSKKPAEKLGSMELGSDGGEFTNIKTDKPITDDWSDVFARFGRNADEFEIIDDTVRMSTWQQSKALEDGTRDVVDLYSYSARFRRKVAGELDVADIISSLRAWKPAKHKVPVGAPSAFFLGLADWQLGKGEGDGTVGTTARVLAAYEAAAERIKALRKQGVVLNELVFANMGDATEAVAGHYTSQTYSVDLNLRAQLMAAIELTLTGLKLLAPMFEKVTYTVALCNHGQWQRVGGKALTDDADNSSGHLGDILKMLAAQTPGLQHVEFIIPHDEMITTGTFAGVPVAMAHGHKISAAEETWLAKQSSWLHTTKDFRPELWVTAHRHTAKCEDFGPYHRVQCATEDPGSKSFTDGTGKWSTQGTTSFVIDSTSPRKATHYEVL